VNAFNSFITGLTRLLGAPAQLITSFGSRLRMLNPFRAVGPIARTFKNIPQRLMAPLRPLLKKLGVKIPDPKGEKRNSRDDLRDLFAKDSERKARRPVAQVARVSQIHLIAPDEERYILHIGSGAGRAASQLQLFVDGASLILHFAPTEPPDLRAPVTLTAVTGRTAVRVNDQAPKYPARVRSGDNINIEGRPYRVELFMFDRTPVVTRVDASYATSAGPTREDNQDAIAVGQHPKAYLFAVADGVGAGQDGDEVSAFAAKYLLTAFYNNAPYDLPWLDILTTAFRHINAEVRAWVSRSPNPAGTTLTAAVIHNWNAYIAHVGDSRAYLFRQGVIQQLTQDHMQRQPVEMATIVAMEQQEPPPLRDVLTRAIGKTDGVEPQVFGVPLTPGDKLLLTSDGLTNTIPAHEIVTILSGNTSFAAELMIRRAIELEAKDNVTAAVVECLADAYVDDLWEAVPSDRVFTTPTYGRSLKMRKPGDPITNVNPSPVGCLMVITIILIVMIAYWIIAR
jgi:serine/threonine protein phosphatase PrpC